MGIVIRAIVIPLAFIGWIIFQLAVKRKKFRDLESDIKLIIFFVVVWGVIYWVFFH
ncbi:MAG TPA: hypothetical protein VHB48_21295 [Chitinophagaceae bacterium]|nr:hypothetical protein [Chitinophagaceae bacterium]